MPWRSFRVNKYVQPCSCVGDALQQLSLLHFSSVGNNKHRCIDVMETYTLKHNLLILCC